MEDRDFAAYVLTAKKPAALQRIDRRGTSINVNDRGLHAQEASIDDLAGVLQNILGKPVVDETGIAGTFNFDLSWGEDRERTVTASLLSTLGLQLALDRRRLPALVVDRAERGAALSMLARMGRISSPLPRVLRQRLSHALAVH